MLEGMCMVVSKLYEAHYEYEIILAMKGHRHDGLPTVSVLVATNIDTCFWCMG